MMEYLIILVIQKLRIVKNVEIKVILVQNVKIISIF